MDDGKWVWILFGAAAFMMLGAAFWVVQAIASDNRKPLTASDADAPAASVYDFKVTTIDGAETDLSAYRGKVLLIVNTASRCGFTPQYAGLQKLYETYRDRGLVVLAFPANNFMGQEPGTDSEIKEFCSLKFKTTFPLFSKISVKGDGIHPLFRWLTTGAGHDGEVSWNFNKFLVDRGGRLVARFGSRQDPTGEELVRAVESLL